MSDAVKYFQKNGLQRSKELVGMGFGFCSLEDGLSFHTEQLKQILKSQKEQSNDELVFCSVFNKTKIMNKTTINAALRSAGFEALTAHDFRATASTILHEAGYNSEWIEMQLAHVDKNAVRGTYNHAQNLEERRKMMQDWADMVDSW